MTDFKQLFQQNYNNDIASAREFYFVKTQDALNAWRSLSIDDALLESLLKLDYEGFNDYSGINVPLVAVCNVPPVARCNVPPQKWLQ